MPVPMQPTARRLALAVVLLAVAFAPPAQARAGILFRRDRGAALDPGRSPQHGPYDAPVPGIGPPRREERGHTRQAGAHRYPDRVVTGLHRYPCLGGALPAPPYEDCLYPTGPRPWQR
jgi:hypothetical protein